MRRLDGRIEVGNEKEKESEAREDRKPKEPN